MDIQLEVLIPLAVLLVILLTAVVVLLCRFFVWENRFQRKKKYQKVNPAIQKPTGYPKLPPFPKFLSRSPQQIDTQDIITPYVDIDKKPSRSSRMLIYSDLNGRQYEAGRPYEKVSTDSSEDINRSSNSSLISDPDTGFGDIPQQACSEWSFSGSELSYPNLRPKGSKIQPRGRVLSEPNLAIMNLPRDAKGKRHHYSLSHSKIKSRKISSALSINSPVGGQIEFSLYYDQDNRRLDVTICQLLDVTMKAENFLPLLEVYDQPQNTSKVHLVKNSDGQLELSDTSNMAFLIYVTLLPNRHFSRHTNVVFGTGDVVFNEKFPITGYTKEQFTKFQLCFHALCKLGCDGEPIILGEIKIPLKSLKIKQVIPITANLEPPNEVLEVENYLKPSTDLGYLEVYLAYNPLGQKLVVKIVQATGLPKIGVTGHPNVSIKASIYYCNKRVCKRSTIIKKRARDPVYCDTFQFDLSRDRLQDCDVLFEIRHHGPMYRTVIGYVTIGSSVGGEGEKHWKALLDFSYHEKQHKIMSHKPVALL